MARAFSKLSAPPRRSILFLAVTAEEQGLLGSQYYSVTPVYSLAKTVADINMDSWNVHGRTKDLTIVGYGASNDAFDMVQPDELGAGALIAMRAALADAAATPDEVGFISAHGTGTPINDRVETLAIRTMFGADAPPISSTKSAIGHLLGAAGSTEALVCIEALRRKLLPPTINYSERDPDCDLDYLVDGAQVPFHRMRRVVGRHQRRRVGNHNRVMVHVDDPRPGTALLGDLVDVRAARQPAAEVEKLADSGIPQELDGAGQETTVTPNRVHDLRHDGEHLLSDRPVRGEVVLTT